VGGWVSVGGWVVASLSPPQTSKGKSRSGGEKGLGQGIAQQVCLINAL